MTFFNVLSQWSMTWRALPNITDLNALPVLRCVFLQRSWLTYWDFQAQRAA
jgi:hypothetical protein